MQLKALRAIQGGESCHVQLRLALHPTFGGAHGHAMNRILIEPHSRVPKKHIHSRVYAAARFIAATASEEHPTTAAASADTTANALLQRPTLVLAGFLLEELPHIRLTLDAAGGQDIVIVVSHPDLLLQPVEQALEIGEPSWDQPIPPQWVDGGGWARRRVILFCGLGNVEQSSILQVLEESGIDSVFALELTADDIGNKLGIVLSKAVEKPSAVDEDIGFVPSTGALPKIEIVNSAQEILSTENIEAEPEKKDKDGEGIKGEDVATDDKGSGKATEPQRGGLDLDVIDRLAASLGVTISDKD